MKKLTLYKKGGKLYYKKGGKMCLYKGGGPIRYRKKPLKQFQQGGNKSGFDIKLNDNPSFSSQYGNTNTTLPSNNPYRNNVLDQTEATDNAAAQKQAKTMNNIGNYANLASTAFSMIPKQETTFGDTDIGRNAFGQGEQTKGGVRSMMSGVQSAIPVWGAVAGATQGLTDAIDQKDEYGISKSNPGAVISNVISPSKSLAESIAVGKEYGAGAGFLNQLTFGMAGKALQEERKKMVEDENAWRDARNNSFEQPIVKRGGMLEYAKYGKDLRITPYNSLNNPNAQYTAEVEDGELILGDGIGSLQHGGHSTASMVSPYAVKLSGDKHGQDSDGDGQEGIPVVAREGLYVASNYLGLNGRKAKKGQKTVAKEMEPIVESLAIAEKGGDIYNSNKELVKHQLAELEVMKNEAETNKAAEELKKMLGKKDRDMSEISEFIAQNAEYLMPQSAPQQEGPLPQMEVGPQMAQTGGKIQGPIREDLEQHATDELGVPEAMVASAQDVDPGKFAFADPGTYTGQSGQEYETESTVNDEIIPASEAENEVTVEEGDVYTDEREGGTEDETTMGEQAGKSQYTGTSNLIQEKMQEVLDPKIFSDEGGLSQEWIEQGVKEGIPRKALMEAKRKSITDGQVGSWLGTKMQEAFGVRSMGKDTPHRSVDAAVSGKSDNLYNKEELNWAEDVRKDIAANDGVVPSKYADLPEDLLDELTSLARSGKMTHEGTFSPSLGNAFREANTADTTEIARQGAATYQSGVDEGGKIDRNTDLAVDERAGKIKSFSDAFRFTRNNPELFPEGEFTYKGGTYSTATRSEDPELAKASDAAAIAGRQQTEPKRTTNVKPQQINMKARNPKSRLKQIMRKKGGLMAYQTGGRMKLSDRIRARDLVRNTAMPATRNVAGIMKSGMGQLSGMMNRGLASRRDETDWSNYVGGQINQAEAADLAARNAARRASLGLAPKYGQRPAGRGNAVGEAARTSGIMNAYMNGGLTGYQQGGMMQEGQEPMPGGESNAHAQQLMGEEGSPGPVPGDAELAAQEGQGQDPMGGQVPQPIAALAPEVQQIFMQLPPEAQEQILQLPPDQMEVAIMTIAQQMQGGQGGAPQPQGGMAQGPGSPVPQGVVDQMG